MGERVSCWVQFSNSQEHWRSSEFYKLSEQSSYIHQGNVVVTSFRLTFRYE